MTSRSPSLIVFFGLVNIAVGAYKHNVPLLVAGAVLWITSMAILIRESRRTHRRRKVLQSCLAAEQGSRSVSAGQPE